MTGVFEDVPLGVGKVVGHTVRYIDEVEGSATRFEQVRHLKSGIEALDAWTRAWASYIPHIAPVAEALLSARHDDEAAAKHGKTE